MQILFNIYALFFGLIFGSFLNVLVSRTHDEESLMTRSHCTKCKSQIAWFDNIPIISFLLLRGKCRKCGEKISFKYPIIELLVGLVSLFCYYISYDLISYILLFSISFFILYFSIYDIFYQEIFDKLAIPVAILLLILNIVSYFYPISIYTRLFTLNFGLTNILSAIIYSLLVVLIIVISRGKMGAGDIRFAVIAGLLLSPDKLYFGIMSTYVVGSVVGVIVAIIKRKFRGIPLPFIPFMGIGIFLSYILGSEFWKFLTFQKFLR